MTGEAALSGENSEVIRYPGLRRSGDHITCDEDNDWRSGEI